MPPVSPFPEVDLSLKLTTIALHRRDYVLIVTASLIFMLPVAPMSLDFPGRFEILFAVVSGQSIVHISYNMHLSSVTVIDSTI